MSTESIVHAYFDAWTQGRFGVARQLLDDKLKFRGSIDHFDSADDFVTTLRLFGQMVQGVKLQEQFVDGDRAALLYDCITTTAAGAVRSAEFFKVRNGRITEIALIFDATQLRKVMER